MTLRRRSVSVRKPHNLAILRRLRRACAGRAPEKCALRILRCLRRSGRLGAGRARMQRRWKPTGAAIGAGGAPRAALPDLRRKFDAESVRQCSQTVQHPANAAAEAVPEARRRWNWWRVKQLPNAALLATRLRSHWSRTCAEISIRRQSSPPRLGGERAGVHLGWSWRLSVAPSSLRGEGDCLRDSYIFQPRELLLMPK